MGTAHTVMFYVILNTREKSNVILYTRTKTLTGRAHSSKDVRHSCIKQVSNRLNTVHECAVLTLLDTDTGQRCWEHCAEVVRRDVGGFTAVSRSCSVSVSSRRPGEKDGGEWEEPATSLSSFTFSFCVSAFPLRSLSSPSLLSSLSFLPLPLPYSLPNSSSSPFQFLDLWKERLKYLDADFVYIEPILSLRVSSLHSLLQRERAAG